MREPSNILIIRLSSLGDVLLTSPLIRVLRQKFPRARIDFLVRREYAELVKYNPHLTRVWEFDASGGLKELLSWRQRLREQRYQVMLDVHRNLRSLVWTGFLPGTRVYRVKKNQFLRFLLVKFKINLYRRVYGRVTPVWEKYLRTGAALGLKPDGARLELFLPPEAEETAAHFYRKLPAGRWEVVMSPGARHFTKRWPMEYFAEVIQTLHERHGLHTILVGGTDDREVGEAILSQLPPGTAISTMGQLSILETAALMKRAGLVISNDSGLMHVAAALERPLIALFGSTVEELGFFPVGKQATVLEVRGLKCRPCSHIGRATCPRKHFRCMRDLLPSRVLEVAERKLGLKP